MSGGGTRLGRGLAALLGEAGVSGAPGTLAGTAPRTVLPLTAMEPGPFQPRVSMDTQALAELTDSVRRQGVLQPILVRPAPDVHGESQGMYQIIAGERRWRAAQAAGLHEVPVLVRPMDDRDAMAAGLVENLQRQDLDAIEEAEGFRRLVTEFGLTQEQLGSAVGKSRSHVANTMRLLGLPDAVRAQVQAKALSAGHARALLSHPDPAAAARAVIDRGLNVRQTEALADRPPASVSKPGPKPAPDPEVAALERDLSQGLGMRVRVQTEGRGGTVRIAYRSLDQLELLLERLRG